MLQYLPMVGYNPSLFVIRYYNLILFCVDFVVSGTCTANLHGMCEALYKPNMEPDELFEVLSQCLLAAVDRDALSGWGAVVHIITKDGTISRKLKCRQD